MGTPCYHGHAQVRKGILFFRLLVCRLLSSFLLIIYPFYFFCPSSFLFHISSFLFPSYIFPFSPFSFFTFFHFFLLHSSFIFSFFFFPYLFLHSFFSSFSCLIFPSFFPSSFYPFFLSSLSVYLLLLLSFHHSSFFPLHHLFIFLLFLLDVGGFLGAVALSPRHKLRSDKLVGSMGAMVSGSSHGDRQEYGVNTPSAIVIPSITIVGPPSCRKIDHPNWFQLFGGRREILKGENQRTPWVEKRGVWKTSSKRGFGPPPRPVRFPPLSGVSAPFFLYKNPRQSRPEALLEGSKNFRKSAFSGTFSSPPYVLRPPYHSPKEWARRSDDSLPE